MLCYDATVLLYTIWQHFVLNTVSQNDKDLFKFHYAISAIAAIWQHWRAQPFLPYIKF
jgi:hypothetical protein